MLRDGCGAAYSISPHSTKLPIWITAVDTQWDKKTEEACMLVLCAQWKFLV
jgi:hypothetical protein